MSITDLLAPDQEEETGIVKGVAIGVVTNNEGDAGKGQIKVKLPWRDHQESFWVRLAVPMAGADRGTYFVPEVGDEVLLAFDQGDIRHPYMIGALWNGQDSPPQTNADGENNVRQIRSRSGHELTFDDTAGAEAIEIKTAGGHIIRLDDSSGSEKIEIKDSTGSNKIIIDSAKGSMELESAQSLKIKSNSIDIEAGASMNIKASGTLTIQGALVQIN